MRIAHVKACPLCRGRLSWVEAQVLPGLLADKLLGAGRDGAAVCAACGAWVHRKGGTVSLGDGLRITLQEAPGKVVPVLTDYGRAYLASLQDGPQKADTGKHPRARKKAS